MNNTPPQPSAETASTIHPETRLGHVHYTVAHLDRQLEFYQKALGFKLHWREGGAAGLGAGGNDLLRLTEVPGARRAQHTTGAYHFALLFPNRRELALAIARLFVLRYPNYPTDHIVSKTTYLDDLEGNNIELYIYSLDDGAYQQVNGKFVVQRADGTLSDGREPLDVEALFRELSPDDRLDVPLPETIRMGHVHLYGANLDDSLHFYHDVLGFATGVVMRDFRMGDVALSPQRPHVIAFNTWIGEGAPPSPPNALGLRYFTIVLPAQDELERVLERIRQANIPTEPVEKGVMVHDPSHIRILLTDDPTA